MSGIKKLCFFLSFLLLASPCYAKFQSDHIEATTQLGAREIIVTENRIDTDAGSLSLGRNNSNAVNIFEQQNDNRPLRQYGYITEDLGRKQINWLVDDNDDWFNLNREDTFIKGLKVNMPLQSEHIEATFQFAGEHIEAISGIESSGDINVEGGRFYEDGYGLVPITFMNGSFRETFNALVTSDGATITMTLTNATSSPNLTMQFGDGLTTLTTPVTIELTAGTTASPQENYIYIPVSTKVLTKDTTGWPTEEHIKVSYFLVPTAAKVQSEGTYINQNWNDHLTGTDNQGHMLHMGERSRRDGAYYFSGVDPNGTDQGASSSYFNYVAADESYFKSTAGVIYQMHRHAYVAKDTSASDDMHVVNWNGDAYHEITQFNEILVDANGTSLSNKYFNIVIFGVGNKGGEYSPVMINLPTGSYNTQTNAEQDALGYDVLSMPREFNLDSSTGFLIARMTLRYTGGTGTLEHTSTVDLRGQTPTTAAGGATGNITNFPDNTFTVFDNTDSTKILAFDVGAAVTTGNTRTYTAPDADGTLAISATSPATLNATSGDIGVTVAKDIVTTSPLTVNAGANLDNVIIGTDADITWAINDAAADDSTKGAATFEADDFDSASGKIDLANSVFRLGSTDSGTATPDGHALTFAGGEGIDTSGASSTVTIAGEDATDANKGVISVSDTTNFTVASGDLTMDRNVDVVATSPLTVNGTTNVDNVIPGADADITIAPVILKDLVTTAPITGATNDVFLGTDADLTIGIDVLKDIVTTSPLAGGENDVLPGADADLTLSIADAAADDTTKGAATFEADDFDSASGKIDLATSVMRLGSTDSGTATPAGHALTFAGAGISATSGAGSTVTITSTEADTLQTVSGRGASYTGTHTLDGLTMDANENITLGGETLDHDGTDFVFSDTVHSTGFRLNDENTANFGTNDDGLISYNETDDIWSFQLTDENAADDDYGLVTIAIDNDNTGVDADQEVFEIGIGDADDSGANWTELFAVNDTGQVTIAKEVGIYSSAPADNTMIKATGLSTTDANAKGINLIPAANAANSNANVTAIEGYSACAGDSYTASSATNANAQGLAFGTYGVFGTIDDGAGGKSAFDAIGIAAYGHAGFGATTKADEAYALMLIPVGTVGGAGISGTFEFTDAYGIYIHDSTGGTQSHTNEYGLVIDKTTEATNGYQIVLNGTGNDTGIWFGGTSGERVHSDGTDLIITPELQISDTNTGGNTGSDLCLGADNTVCVCGTCN